MKSTYKFILAALAATAVLAACTKDPVPGKSDSDSAATYRTITVSFDTPTKAILDGAKPKFQAGDTILLSDGTALDTCVVEVTAGVAAIETKLKEKKLTAVYPMKAVKNTALNGNPDDIASEPLIPTKQSGRFSDANICTATTGEDGKTDKLQFKNVYPILRFYVDKSIKVKSIKIEIEESSHAYIALDTAKTCDDDDRTIIVDAGDSGTLDKVTGERVCYVAVRNQVPAYGLTFTSVTETQGTVVRKSSSNDGLRQGWIYNAFIPYSIQVGDQKWGYCNVGAFYPEDPGYYFAWGETAGYKWNGEKFDEGRLFNWEMYEYNGKNISFDEQVFKKYNICPDGVLGLKYDAANANWGEGWRMPTKEEMEVMIKAVDTDLKPDSTGVVFGGSLKIPYSGYGEDSIVKYGKLEAGFNYSNGAYGYCWTSSKTSENSRSYNFSFSYAINSINLTDITFKQTLTPSIYSHYYSIGLPVRPFFDDTMSGGDENPVGLQIGSYTDGKTL